MATYPEMPIDFAFIKQEEDLLRERILAGEDIPDGFLQEITPELAFEMATKHRLASLSRRSQVQPNILLGSRPIVPFRPRSLAQGHCAQFSEYFLKPLPPHVRQHLLLAGGAVTDELLDRNCVKDWDFFWLDWETPILKLSCWSCYTFGNLTSTMGFGRSTRYR